MAKTTADVLVERLIDWGVDIVFGLPGDGINGIMEALRKRQDKIRFVQVRHEEAAAFMACGYAKFTGRLGVCLATSGPGAIHLLNGLYDAKLDGAPVLAITGQTYHDLIGTHYQQDVDLLALFKDVARLQPAGHRRRPRRRRSSTPAAAPRCRCAGVAHITCPGRSPGAGSQRRRAVGEEGRGPHLRRRGGRRSSCRATPTSRAAADVLNAGKKTVILAGQGALGAATELEQLADLLAAPIVKPLLGKARVPDDSPFTTGGIGLLGTAPSRRRDGGVRHAADGRHQLPVHGVLSRSPTAAAACRSTATRRGSACATRSTSASCGDAKATLQALLPLIRRRDDRSFLENGAERHEGVARADAHARAPRRRADEAAGRRRRAERAAGRRRDRLDRLGHDHHLGGAPHPHEARPAVLVLRQPGHDGAAGCPTPSRAQVAYPDRQSVAFVGDGGFTMLMGEFATAVKYHLPIKVVIIKNNTLGQIKWEQMVFLGNPEYGVSLQPIDFVRFAEACGGVGFRCERPEEARPALEAMLLADGPALCEAVVDPFEPPMPARVKAKQALHMAESLARGEPNRGRIALTLFRDKVHDFKGR